MTGGETTGTRWQRIQALTAWRHAGGNAIRYGFKGLRCTNVIYHHSSPDLSQFHGDCLPDAPATTGNYGYFAC